MKKILVPIDFSEGSVLAANEAIMFARAFEASLVLLHVIHDPEESPGFYAAKKAGKMVFQNMEESARQMVQDFTEQHLEGFEDFKALTVQGIPAARVLQTAKKRKADLIVMGTRGRGGMDRVMLGSVADKVVRGANCPVLVLREPRESKSEGDAEESAADGGSVRSVVVPVDFSDGSAAALKQAVKVSKRFGAKLAVIHVIHDPNNAPGFYTAEEAGQKVFRNMEDTARDMMAEFAEDDLSDVEDCETFVVCGVPAAQIVGAAEQQGADLIVMGSHGRGGFDRLLIGSVADKVVRGGPCPVMVVREKKNEE